MQQLWTENQIEEWLKFETKRLLMPDGSSRSVKATKLLWEHYEEEVLKIGGYTPEEVIGFTLGEAKGAGRSFDEAFTIIVAYVAQVVRDRDWGDDEEDPFEMA